MSTRAPANRGFTLIEMLVALPLGLLVLGSAMSFAVMTWRLIQADTLREEVYRNARFVGMSFERDLREAGVGIESTVSFGTLSTWADTIVVMQVPEDARPYEIAPPAGTDNPLPPGGTCGLQCISLEPITGGVDLQARDLARLQVNDERRLIIVQNIVRNGPIFEVTFTNAPKILGFPAGLAGGLRLDRFSTFVQRLGVAVYYPDADRLMRAERLNLDGTPDGDILAYGVQSFEARLIFLDGDEADEGNPGDSDTTNDFDDLLGIRIETTLAGDYPHPNVNAGELFTRDYQWRFIPRNLMYERNRM